MKNKPFLISGLIFGLIGVALLAAAGISFISNSNAITKALASVVSTSPDNISNATIAQLGFIFMIPSFIFTYKSFVDTEDEAQTVSVTSPVPAEEIVPEA